ncbi:MAG TPA: tetratricopeptide repeat protein [Leptospiraceae bacterium]|nr:tetratricopeptide repeat protein [Leptospiraceae bacterium]
MNDIQKLILAGGFLLLTGGIALLTWERFGSGYPLRFMEVERNESVIEKADRQLKEAEEYLRQNSRDSYAKAKAICTEVLSRNLNDRINQIARYELAEALEKLDDNAAALEHYRALKQDQDKIQSQELRDKVDYSLGRLLLVINHEVEGRSLLESLLARTNDGRLKSRIHTAFGQFYLARGDRQRAQENFNIALKYFPENLQAEIGRTGAVNGQRKSMYYEYYDEYLTGNANLSPDKRAAQSDLRLSTYEAGIRAYKAGRYQDAVDAFGRVLKDGRDNVEAEKSLYWTGESLQALGRTREAYETYERVLGNATSVMDQAALIRMGMILYQQGKLQEALTRFYRASENYPDGAYTSRALEWKRETEAQIREHDFLKNYDDRKKEDPKTDTRPQSRLLEHADSEIAVVREEDRARNVASADTTSTASSENSDADKSEMIIEVDGKEIKLAERKPQAVRR